MAMLNNQRVDEKKTDDARFLLLATYISTKSFTCFAYGGFLRWGHPQIIHFGRIFHEINHPAIWGTPMAMESPKLIGHQKNSTDMFTVHHLELGIQLLSARAGSDGCYNPMVAQLFNRSTPLEPIQAMDVMFWNWKRGIMVGIRLEIEPAMSHKKVTSDADISPSDLYIFFI